MSIAFCSVRATHSIAWHFTNKEMFAPAQSASETTASFSRATATMAETKMYTITSHPHLRTLPQEFFRMYESGFLTDTTVVTEDKAFSVHRAVLSVTSGYFETVFANANVDSATIFLPKVDSINFARLITYIYLGNASVPEASLEEFLKLAAMLQIRGLCATPDENAMKTNPGNLQIPPFYPKRVNPPPVSSTQAHGIASSVKSESVCESAKGKRTVSCNVCGRTLSDPSSLYRHKKTHLEVKPHQCPRCPRRFIQKYKMMTHMRIHSKEEEKH